MGYRDIKAEIFRRIRQNIWGPGTLLPSEVDLASEFKCARATVNRAMQELQSDGIIERKRKGGSHVKHAPLRQVTFEIPLVRTEILATGAQYKYQLITSILKPVPIWFCRKLNITAATPTRHIQCLHFANDKPYQFEDRWINLKAVPKAKAADFSTLSPNEWLVNEVPYTDAELRFSATQPTRKIAKLLKATTTTPIFKAERTTWLASVPVTNVKLYFAPDYQMVARY